MKRNLFIYQIYYSKETQTKLDPGFIPLNNVENKNPVWREYWCIKNFFKKNKIINKNFYGFFSPKLFEKTGLTSSDIYNFINKNKNDIDVFLFNPIKKSSFVFFNVIDQAIDKHKSKFYLIFKKIFRKKNFNFTNLVNHSNNTVYCNYFIARGFFWKEWLEINKFLFSGLERRNQNFRISIPKIVKYKTEKVALKVFVMERVASLILAFGSEIKRSSYNIFNMPNFRNTNFYSKKIYLFLDYLKIKYEKNNKEIYKILFFLFSALIK